MAAKAKKAIQLFDESPQFNRPVEWWFVHGYYAVKPLKKRYFMVSLFRQHIPDEKGRDMHYAIQTIFDEESGQCKSHMLIHKNTWDFVMRYRHKEDNADEFLVPLCLEELRKYGPAPEIVITEKEVVLSENPLKFKWQDFSLVQDKEGFQLRFLDPFSRKPCAIFIKPDCPRLDFNAIGMTAFTDMAYFCYPSMKLEGQLNKTRIKGNAWFEHQFGGYKDTFFKTDNSKGIFGWDWLSITLDGGVSVLMIINRDMKSRQAKFKSVFIKKGGHEPEVFNNFQVEVLRYWESEKTHIVYPLDLKITIPGRDICLVFKPNMDNQEIAYPGPARAIWEGVGNVNANIQGRAVKGYGRLELYGYGYIFDIKLYMEHFIRRFDQHIEEFFPKELNEEVLEQYLGSPHWKNEPEAYKHILSAPIWDLMTRKGKHWRPIFGVLFLDSLGYSSKNYERLIVTLLELNHTGALIIDDIEDNSLIRRGDKAIHLKYGTDVAINAGNTLYFLPYVQVSNYPYLDQQQKFDVYRLMVKVWVRSHFGQSLDIYWSKYLSRENLIEWSQDSLEEKILQMYAYKTSSAVEGVGEAACIIARADEKTRLAYMSLGRIFGTAFQIIDDINNFSQSKDWRKNCGEDLMAGKVTYVMVCALRLLPPDKKGRLIEIITSVALRNDPAVLKEGISLIRESGALQACRKNAQEMIDKEWLAFSEVVPPSDSKMMLKVLISGLTHVVYES